MPIVRVLLRSLLLMAAGLLSLASIADVKDTRAQGSDAASSCEPATAVVLSLAANVRFGPGINYSVHSPVSRNTELIVIGRHPQYSWWLVLLPSGEEGWVSDLVIQVRGDLEQIPLVQANGEQTAGTATWDPESLVPCTAALTTSAATTPLPEIREENGEWTLPVNLSSSGKASEPRAVIVSTGVVHLIWQEEGMQQFLYVTGDGVSWSEPRQIELPFGTRSYFPDLAEDDLTPLFTPQLVTTGDGHIHAFWTDEDQVLWHSALNGSFDTFDDWGERQQLADSAVGLDVAVGGSGGVFVSFIRPAEAGERAAGVYVTRSEGPPGEVRFAEPTLLYRSRYFVGVEEENAHTQVWAAKQVTEDGEPVFVAWDNRPQGKVFVARSTDAGATWAEPLVVDRRQENDAADAEGPSRITLSGVGKDVLLVWQAAHGGETCNQFYQWSADGGASWSEQKKLATVPGCPTHMDLLTTDDGMLLLLTAAEQGVSLRAWNRNSWSDEQPQPVLSEFTDPETFRPVHLQCFQVDWLTAQNLFVAGCNDDGMKDLWATTRQLPAISHWFEQASAWWSPGTVGTGITPLTAITSMQLVTDKDGRFHAFWGEQGSEAIHYAQYEGKQWTGTIPILSSPSGGTSSHVDVTYGHDNLIHATWGSSKGNIYYSRADAAMASLPPSWSTPQELPTVHENAAMPAMAISDTGALYVAYAIPINEGRGVYLTHSEDGGNTWSEPALVFDAANAGWQVVGKIDMALTTEGRLHLLWSRGVSSFNPETTGPAVYYGYSDDALSFATVAVVEDIQTEYVGLAAGERAVHRFWQVEGDETTLWHAYSNDAGSTWSDAMELSYVSATLAPIVDQGGQLHLLQVDGTALVYRQWDGVRWMTVEQVERENPPTGLGAAAISSNGELMLVYAGQADVESEGYEIVATGRHVEVPRYTSTPQPTPRPMATPTSTPSPTPAPTATRFFPAPVAGGKLPRMISNIGVQAAGLGGAIGLIAVALVSLVIVIRSAHALRRRS